MNFWSWIFEIKNTSSVVASALINLFSLALIHNLRMRTMVSFLPADILHIFSINFLQVIPSILLILLTVTINLSHHFIDLLFLLFWKLYVFTFFTYDFKFFEFLQTFLLSLSKIYAISGNFYFVFIVSFDPGSEISKTTTFSKEFR